MGFSGSPQGRFASVWEGQRWIGVSPCWKHDALASGCLVATVADLERSDLRDD